MADLQAALKEFESEIASLEKKKASLTQDCTTLAAKQSFLKHSVKAMQSQSEDAKKNYNKAAGIHKARLAELTNKIADTQAAIDGLELKLAQAKSDLQVMHDAHEGAITKLGRELKDKQAEISAAEKLKQAKLDEIKDTEDKLLFNRTLLAAFPAKIEAAQAETDDKIDQIGLKIEAKKDKLTAVNKQIDEAVGRYDQLESEIARMAQLLKDSTAKHESYLEYEKRADKALKARETALLEGEQRLSHAKRRGGVLDNIT